MPAQYTRPVVEDENYLDEFGRPVLYGRHRTAQSDRSSQAGATNVFSHQERYEPIWTVADALIAYLASAYDVTVDRDPRHATAFCVTRRSAAPSFVRVVRIRPAAPDEAPLVFGFHDRPGSLQVSAGNFAEFDRGFCGCDACDEPWEDIADTLEEVVLAVAASGVAEYLPRPRWKRARYSLTVRGRTMAGSIPRREMRPQLLAYAEDASQRLTGGTWKPWTQRMTVTESTAAR